ncbi:MAG: glycosyltransferase family 39 protein [Saprospiraceae bacterium]
MPQDAYYYLYSTWPDWSYFDHPPMVAWMLKAGTTLMGKSVLAIKLTDFLVSGFTFFLFYRLSLHFATTKQAITATILFGSTLMLSVLSINTTPDVPLLLCWTLTLILFYRAISQDHWYWWALSGMLAGLAFDSKYTAVFLLAGMTGFLLISPLHRHRLWSFKWLLLLIGFAIAISPVVYWNIVHEWASFRFQSAERASSISALQLKPRFFAGHIGTQLLLLLPPLFVGLMATQYRLVVQTIRSWQWPDTPTLFLLAFSLPMIFFFYGVSTVYWVKLNWIMPAYLSAIILTVLHFPRPLIRWQIAFSVLLHIIVAIQIIAYPIRIKTDDTWVGWDTIREQVQ